MYVAIRYQHKIYICNETFQCLEAMIRFSLDYDKNSSKVGDERWHNLDTVWSLLRLTWSKKLNKCT